ncbi:hypothetical protein AJ85_07270 [Alkalihalobacillus alcalophilus ATCC 27647 = CGMCC 1.3604]|uniref:Uncharacterized protein n=1 Tax=Alkalihalobacillus alcalophilus ATCC 27647 = CGMCC 1.3604 TaxID=1218173 RepID=A0A094WMI6_ALKAL|nr:cell wall-active antibiotics response protein LiaF [Alkalihalobacillus alcalophilus]KGA98076.1 hypothetical protein BALCAV_0206665 [Alkalihalobacillus alcalophilus ATCC 27647 = CGMCC 1.3604]MED1561037.1 cell wall-active antibiotics response protein LiaF [Alkalihalobacillus alcalophilus]THG88340.1 hypothetical protein AJ85_07270 [Alkalihalobacillus alcalophilus ATCC 27647 = CGMCC 1.3604]
MSKKFLFGLVIIIIGVNLLLNAFFSQAGSLIAPLIFIVIGYYFYQRGRRVLSTIFFIMSAIMIFDQFFGLNFIALLFAGIFLFYGMKLMKGSSYEEQSNSRKRRKKRQLQAKQKRKRRVTEEEITSNKMDDEDDKWDYRHDYDFEEELPFKKGNQRIDDRDVHTSSRSDDPRIAARSFNSSNGSSEKTRTTYSTGNYAPVIKRNILGDIHYNREQFELKDMTIWNGIGDIRVDLSRAIIPEGEHIIIIQAVIGQVDLYVPEDLKVTIQAYSFIGDVSIFHEKHSGFNQQIHIAPSDYKQSPRRIKLILNTLVGEVRVRSI